MKIKGPLLMLIFVAGIVSLSGCKEKNSKSGSSTKPKKNVNVVEKVSHGVVFGGSYQKILEDGSLDFFADVIPGSYIETVSVNGSVESKQLNLSGGATNYLHVKYEDSDYWVDEKFIVVDADPEYILETGTDIYLYENPDADSKRVTRLISDTIVASFGKCEESSEFPESTKFCRIKFPATVDGEYQEGYVRVSNIDDSPAHLAYIQVSRKYNQLLNSGNVSTDILNELEDTMEDLRSWSGR